MNVGCEFCQHPVCWKHNVNSDGITPTYNEVLKQRDSPWHTTTPSGVLPMYTFNTFSFAQLLTERNSGYGQFYEDLERTNESDIEWTDNEEDEDKNKENNYETFTKNYQKIASMDQFFPTPNTSMKMTQYIQRLRSRQKEVEKLEDPKNCFKSKNRLMLQDMHLNSEHEFCDDFQKIFTWVPGKKRVPQYVKKDNTMTSTVIDGDSLPDEMKIQVESFSRTRTPTALKRSCKKKKPIKIFELPPIFYEQLTLEDYVHLFHLNELRGYDVDSRGNVSVPSPLRTTRMSIVPQQKTTRPQYQITIHENKEPSKGQTTPLNLSNNKTMYIEGGNLRQKSLVFLKSRQKQEQEQSRLLENGNKNTPEEITTINENSNESKSNDQHKKKRRMRPNLLTLKLRKEKMRRDMIELTHVSIPRNALKKYPVFHHCKQSIRKGGLDNEIFIKPLTLSEQNSNSTLSTVDGIVTITTKEQPCEAQNRECHQRLHKHENCGSYVPDPSPISYSCNCFGREDNKNMFEGERVKERSFDGEGKLKVQNNKELGKYTNEQSLQSSLSTGVNTEPSSGCLRGGNQILKGRSSVHFQVPRKYSSDEERRTSTAPSILSASALEEPSRSRNFSRTTSILSRPSSEDSCLDKELISRTYAKYNSLTPFKTPMQSRHGIAEDIGLKDKAVLIDQLEKLSTNRSKRNLMSRSMKNLNETFLEEEHDTHVRRNGSFISRSLSPSKSTFLKQQKQAVKNIVPTEIKISQVQLFPARERSPFLLNKDSKYDHHPTSFHQNQQQKQHQHNINTETLSNAELTFVQVFNQEYFSNQHVPPPSPALSKQTDSEIFITQSPSLCSNNSNVVKELEDPEVQLNDKTERIPGDIPDEINESDEKNNGQEMKKLKSAKSGKESNVEKNHKENFKEGKNEVKTQNTSNVYLNEESIITNEHDDKYVSKSDDLTVQDTLKVDNTSKLIVTESRESKEEIDVDYHGNDIECFLDVVGEIEIEIDDNDEVSSLTSDASSTLDPIEIDDFTDGLSLNFELDEEIMKAMDNIDEFLRDDEIDDLEL